MLIVETDLPELLEEKRLIVKKQSGDDRILVHQSVCALDLLQARPGGCLPLREGLALISATGFTQ